MRRKLRFKKVVAMVLSSVMVTGAFSCSAMAATPSPKMEYMFDTSIAGDANGVVTILDSDSAAESFVLYWGDDQGKLKDYAPIITLSRNQAKRGYRMVNSMAIPKGATRLLAYPKQGDKELDLCQEFDIPESKRVKKEEPLTTMFFISDIHIDEANSVNARHYEEALEQIKTIDNKASAIVINGDIADKGLASQYALEKSLVEKHKEGLPPIYYNIGNHDAWDKTDGKNGSENYMAATGNPLRYDVTVAGKHLVFLGQISPGSGGVDIELTNEDLQWLDEQLAADQKTGRETYLFIHQGISNTVSGTFSGQWMYHHVVNEAELKAVLDRYPSVIFISGHSHMNLDARITAQSGLASGLSYINDSSTAYLTVRDSDVYTGADDGAGSQGMYVEIYRDHLVLNGRDFVTKEWIPRSTLRLDLVNQDTALGQVSIEGEPVVNQVLKANVSDLSADVDANDIAYVWYADNDKCGEGKTCRVTDQTVGKRISVKAYDVKNSRVSGDKCKDAVTKNGYPSNYTTFYLDKGAVTIGENSVSGYDKNGSLITASNANGYRITQTEGVTSNSPVLVTGGKHNIELDHVNLTSDQYNFKIDSGADVTLTLRGDNVIRYTKPDSSAALEVTGGGKLTINGTDADFLRADHTAHGSGAGIGGTLHGSCGDITINGGNIAAVGGMYAAGIGGSSTTTTMGKITINGGKVYASVYLTCAPAIGSGWCSEDQIATGTGGEIEINGGIVIAQGGNNVDWNPYGAGAGIGAGPNDHLKKITINGGSVNAMCGSGNVSGEVNDIGNSGYEDNKTLNIPKTPVIINGGSVIKYHDNMPKTVDRNGDVLALTKVDTGLNHEAVTIDINGTTSKAITEQDGSLSIYYPTTKDTIITVTTEDGQVKVTKNISKKDSDVDGHWAKDAILDLMKRGIASGNEKGYFEPDKRATRAEFAQMAATAFSYYTNSNTQVFDDVTLQDWYFYSVMALNNENIVSGVSDKNFAPQSLLTREQMATIIYRILSAKKVELKTSEIVTFIDENQISPWAKEAVNVLQQNGLVSGRDGKFDPQGYATKAEIASVLQRVLVFMEK